MDIIVTLSESEANAAAAVLRGYVQHQRERLGEQAAGQRNLQLVAAALAAIERAMPNRRAAGPAGSPARE
jgi:hypothetical protein